VPTITHVICCRAEPRNCDMNWAFRGIEIMPSSTTHVLPVLIGSARNCRTAAAMLLDEYGIYIQPINPPTVPSGTSRFRINATPAHTAEQVTRLADSLDEVFSRLGISENKKNAR